MKSFDEWYFDLFESGNGSALNQQEIAEEAWDFRQAEVDELQKRIDDALKELEYIHFYKTQNSNNAIKILKGDQS